MHRLMLLVPAPDYKRFNDFIVNFLMLFRVTFAALKTASSVLQQDLVSQPGHSRM